MAARLKIAEGRISLIYARKVLEIQNKVKKSDFKAYVLLWLKVDREYDGVK